MEGEERKIAELEALLFYYGEEVSISKISKVLGIPEGKSRDILKTLKESLDSDSSRGLTILEKEGRYQLATKPEAAEMVRKIASEELKESLTPAALEALAIIAYLGPVPRSVVDYIRGVNSSFILRSLLVKGLAERRVGEKRSAYLYDISFDFLKHIGVDKKENLPEYEKFRNILERHKENLET